MKSISFFSFSIFKSISKKFIFLSSNFEIFTKSFSVVMISASFFLLYFLYNQYFFVCNQSDLGKIISSMILNSFFFNIFLKFFGFPIPEKIKNFLDKSNKFKFLIWYVVLKTSIFELYFFIISSF